jgi:pyruvate dehydrogenase E2 component (dihydrolipoamide acetyltransferase)
MEEGRLIAWRKKVGDPVKRGEVLAEIETDKADMEFEAYTEGTLAQIVVDAGATVPVGTLIAVLRLPGEAEGAVAAEEAPAAQPKAEPAAAPEPAAAKPAPAAPRAATPSRPAPAPTPARVELPPAPSGPRVVAPIVQDGGRIRATPRARRLAEEKSIDLSELTRGPSGAIVASDIEAYLTQSRARRSTATAFARPARAAHGERARHRPRGRQGQRARRIITSRICSALEARAGAPQEREAVIYRGTLQLSQKRKELIRNMVRSKAEAPHFYIEMDVSTDALREVRDQVNREAGDKRPRLTYTHLMLKAAALALERHPQVNATYRPEENDIAIYDAINIGLAVDVQDELVAPTVKDCQGRSVWELAEEANSLIQRARMRKLQPADYADGTFTISNLGMFGVDRFYAIITPPQSSILSVSSIAQRPIVRDGKIEIGSITTLGLSVDHRVVDGVRAAQFLAEIKRLVEGPRELVQDGPALG